MHPTGPRRPHCIASIALALACALPLASASFAAPTLGFVENWSGVSLQNWGGGANYSNPGAGGVDGLGDGYLHFTTPNGIQHRLGTRSFGPEYQGNWQTAGISQVRLWLKDVGADDPLEMHFSLGIEQVNFWQYDIAFLPPTGQWAEFVVDLSSATNWTRIIGTTGTFAAALQGVTAIHVRHDNPPFSQVPDELDGDVGLDRVLLTNGIVGVPPGGPVVPRTLHLAAPWPNPSHGPVTFSLEVFDPSPVTLEILDAAGRLVRRTVLDRAEPGTRHWTWDGADETGGMTPAGYYRVRATGRAGGVSRGLVRVK